MSYKRLLNRSLPLLAVGLLVACGTDPTGTTDATTADPTAATQATAATAGSESETGPTSDPTEATIGSESETGPTTDPTETTMDGTTDGTTDPTTDGTTDPTTDGTTDPTTDGTTDPTDATTDPSDSETTSDTDITTTDSQTDTEGIGECPEVLGFNCLGPVNCEDGFQCGELSSPFDSDGCLRPSCTSDEDCAEGDRCYIGQDFGDCLSSNVFCDQEGDMCLCGSSDDCGGAFCVPQEIYPD